MSSGRTQTPWHLWAIGGLSLLWNALGVVDFTATMTRFEPYLKDMLGFNDTQIDFYLSFPWWQNLLWFIGTWGAFGGSILLLLRKKGAVWFLGASFVGALGSMVHGMGVKDAPEGVDPGAMPLVILGIAGLLFAYARWLSRREVLR
jgi:hypothetical protein